MALSRILGVAFCMVAVSTANAEPLIQSGHHELSLHISPDFEGAIGDMIFAQAGYGMFVRDGLELRGTFSYTLLEDVSGAENDYKMWELGAVGEYHMNRDRRVVPYLGLGVGWAKSLFANVDESAAVYGPRAGVKCFLADNAALDFEVTYRFASADVFINDFAREDSDLSLLFGLRVLF
jgi:hypothetical protein